MKNIFLVSLLFFLSSCTELHYNVFSTTPKEKTTVFIDSNVTADVYIGDIEVGTTPYMAELSGEEREMISLRKTGYKTAELPLKTTDTDFARLLLKNDDFRYNYSKAIYYDYLSQYLCDDHLYLMKKKYAIKADEIKRIKQQCENEDYYQYDRDSYFVEMIPENKKSFTKEELKQMRVNLMLEN